MLPSPSSQLTALPFYRVAQTLLHSLPRRPTDGAYTLLNKGENRTVYKLNAGPLPDGKGSEGVLVRRGTEFEYQRGLFCERCQLQVSCCLETRQSRALIFRRRSAQPSREELSLS